MEYYIGIDGGGTKSKYVVADRKLNVIYKCEGGPTNFLVIGLEKAVENIFKSVFECCTNSGIDKNLIKSILLGTAGAGRKSDAEKLEKQFYKLTREKNFPVNVFRVESDAAITLEGAFSSGAGSILIAGTGSIIYGKDDKGNIYRAGGYGRLIGDEGSGFSIGRKGLNTLSKYFDGIGSRSKFIELISKEFQLNNRDDLINKIYNEKFDIASTASLVIKCAEKNDDKCKHILEDECSELLLLVSAMKSNLKTKEMNLCLLGGLLEKENYYSRLLKDNIQKEFPNVRIKSPDNSPEIGAVLKAIKLQ